jgi:hypothetical protein
MSRESILEWLRNDPAWGVVIAPKCWRAEDDDLLELIQRAVAWARAQAARPAAELVPQQAEISVEDVADLASAVLAGAQPASPEPVVAAEISDEELLRTYGLAKQNHCYEGPIDDWPKRAERTATVCGLRAVLARYARPAIQPVAVSEPVGFFPVEYADDGRGIRILMEPADETGHVCWVIRNSRHVNPSHEFPTPEAAYAAHCAAADQQEGKS